MIPLGVSGKLARIRSSMASSGMVPVPKEFTITIPEDAMEDLIRANFPLTPKGIIDHLKLRRPIYQKTAAFGHFGRTDDSFTWEKTDKAEALATAAGKLAVAAR